MNGVFRPSNPADLAQIFALLAEAFGAQPGQGSLDPKAMAWKYWDDRKDWTEPRSYVIEKDGRIVAHAGIWPVTFRGREPAVRGIQMIDWASAKDSPGAGLAIVQRLTRLCDFMYSIGGSAATRRVLPAFGFAEVTRVWTAARPLRPLRQILTHQAVNWKLAPRLIRNWRWSLSPANRAMTDWTTESLDPGQVRDGLIADSFEEARACPRSREFFEYLLRCPTVQFKLYGMANQNGPLGYFALGVALGQARVAGVWLKNPTEEHWRAAFIVAQRVARRLPGAFEIAATGSVGESQKAASDAGLRVIQTTPVFFLSKQRNLALPKEFQFQMGDDDAAFLDLGQSAYLT